MYIPFGSHSAAVSGIFKKTEHICVSIYVFDRCTTVERVRRTWASRVYRYNEVTNVAVTRKAPERE